MSHQNIIIKINLEEFDSFDWDGLRKELKDYALDLNPLMFIFEKPYFMIVRETSRKNKLYEVCVLFMFLHAGKTHQFSCLVRNNNNEFIVIDKTYVMHKLFNLVNHAARKIIGERNASE